MSHVLESVTATQWALNSGVKFRLGLWTKLSSPSWFPPTPLTLGHLENGQREIEAWERIAEWWVGLGRTHTDESLLQRKAWVQVPLP